MSNSAADIYNVASMASEHRRKTLLALADEIATARPKAEVQPVTDDDVECLWVRVRVGGIEGGFIPSFGEQDLSRHLDRIDEYASCQGIAAS